MLLINFFGSPGSGKSTLALRTAGILKSKGYNAEFAPEYIKTLIATGDKSYDNLELLTHQFKQIRAFYDTADVVVTDSPLLLSSVYSQVYGVDAKNYGERFVKSFRELSMALHEDYFKERLDVLVLPCFDENKYKENLRLQNYEESLAIYSKYLKDLIDYDLRIIGIDTNEKVEATLNLILEVAESKLNQ